MSVRGASRQMMLTSAVGKGEMGSGLRCPSTTPLAHLSLWLVVGTGVPQPPQANQGKLCVAVVLPTQHRPQPIAVSLKPRPFPPQCQRNTVNHQPFIESEKNDHKRTIDARREILHRMLAPHRDQENLVHSHQVPPKQHQPKTPSARYPKTPKHGRYDENAPTALIGKSGIGAATRLGGNDKTMTKGHGAQQALVTPMGMESPTLHIPANSY